MTMVPMLRACLVVAAVVAASGAAAQTGPCSELPVKLNALSTNAQKGPPATTPEGRCAKVGQALGLMQSLKEVNRVCADTGPLAEMVTKMMDALLKTLEEQVTSQCK